MTESDSLVAVGAVLAISGVGLIPLSAAVLRHGCRHRRLFFARWGFSHVGLALCAGIVAQLLGGSLLLDGSVLGGLHLSLLTMAVVSALAVRQARALQPEGARALGLGRGAGLRSAMVGLLAYVCLVPVIVGLERVWPTIRGWIELEATPSALIGGILELDGAGLVWALVVCVLIGPLLEELVFRGYLQPLLVQNFSEKGGVALTALIFAALHGAEPFLPLFALACLLGAIQLRTQRLVAVWTVHGVHNALVLLVAFRFPELREIVQ